MSVSHRLPLALLCLSRWRPLLLAIGVAALIGAPPAWALDTATAKDYVKTFAGDVIALLRTNSAQTTKEKQFKDLLQRSASLPPLARYALGAPWRTLDDQQKAAYVEAFTDYVVRIYASRFSAYRGEQLQVVRATDAGSKGVVVDSRVPLTVNKTLSIQWVLYQKNGRPQIRDIIIEGVSMALAQKQRIASLLQKHNGNVEQMIAALQDQYGGL